MTIETNLFDGRNCNKHSQNIAERRGHIVNHQGSGGGIETHRRRPSDTRDGLIGFLTTGLGGLTKNDLPMFADVGHPCSYVSIYLTHIHSIWYALWQSPLAPMHSQLGDFFSLGFVEGIGHRLLSICPLATTTSTVCPSRLRSCTAARQTRVHAVVHGEEICVAESVHARQLIVTY